MTPLARRLLAELIGTAFLLAGIIGSGIMASRLTDDAGLQLLQNAFATAAILVALILALGPVSGAHFNPAVTIADWRFKGLAGGVAALYILAQLAGAFLGALLANLMFDLDAVSIATTERSGANLLLAEVIATFGLLLVIFAVVRTGRPTLAAFTVGAFIAAAFYFTSSTSFANPAVTFGRMFSDTFAGIAPESVPGFVVAELVGMLIAIGVIAVLYPDVEETAGDVIVPHG